MALFRLRSPILLAASAALTLAALPPAEAAGTFLDKEVDVPRETKVAVDMTYQKATLTWVESGNDPQEKDVKDASEKDPKDKTWMLIRFHYRNDDWVKHKIDVKVVLLGPKGEVFSEAGRSGTLDPQKKDDTFSFPIRVRTLDWPKASKLKILATFFD